MRTVSALAALAVVLQAAPAAAQDPQRLQINPWVDGSIIGGAFVGGLLFSLLEVDIERRLDAELFAFDHELRGQFSATAHAASNTLIFANIFTPLAIHVALGADDEMSRIAVTYVEALAISYFLNAATKHIVQRPRPYVYSDDPYIQNFAKGEGIDTHLSFYSGHAAMAFTAAVAGSYMYALRSNDLNARSLIWGVNLAMAAATANLRVRAGRHFYSDVVIGTLIGCGIGLVVPLAHVQDPVEGKAQISTREAIAMGVGFIAGALISELAPMSRDVVLPLEVVPEPEPGGKTGIQMRLDIGPWIDW